jgi:hypothetical protein
MSRSRRGIASRKCCAKYGQMAFTILVHNPAGAGMSAFREGELDSFKVLVSSLFRTGRGGVGARHWARPEYEIHLFCAPNRI